MTTNLGQWIPNEQDSLKVGLREKIQPFAHERIVHARGAAAHGVFRVCDDAIKTHTKAPVLTEPALTTPVFLRFSKVAGSRGSADPVRDVRESAAKFYAKEGNGHSPEEATPGGERGCTSYPAWVEGCKVRERSPSFGDHCGQAKLFWNSQTPVEREYIVKALQVRTSQGRNARRATAHARTPGDHHRNPRRAGGAGQLAILVAPGVDVTQMEAMQQTFKQEGITGTVVGSHLGGIEGAWWKRKRPSPTRAARTSMRCTYPAAKAAWTN